MTCLVKLEILKNKLIIFMKKFIEQLIYLVMYAVCHQRSSEKQKWYLRYASIHATAHTYL